MISTVHSAKGLEWDVVHLLNAADGMLDAVRRRLFAEGSVAEAARCSLDLLVLRVEAGRLDAVSELGPDMLRELQNRVSAFRPAEMIDWLAG